MKAIYVSNERDERSRLEEESLIFGGHTYALKVWRDQISYNMTSYLPELAFHRWRESPAGDRCFLSKEITIETVSESNELRVYDEAFKPSTYYGLEGAKNNLWSLGDIYIYIW